VGISVTRIGRAVPSGFHLHVWAIAVSRGGRAVITVMGLVVAIAAATIALRGLARILRATASVVDEFTRLRRSICLARRLMRSEGWGGSHHRRHSSRSLGRRR